MSPFFGNKENKEDRAAQEAAGNAEVARLIALSASELGAEVLPAFGPDGAPAKGSQGTQPLQIVQWLVSSYGRGVDIRPLVPAVMAGLQSLEHDGLVDRRMSGTGSGAQTFLLTPAGGSALAGSNPAAEQP